MKKKSKHTGQLPLDPNEDLEEIVISTDRPRGMPSLSVIKAEIARQGLTEADAEHMHDIWLLNGFTLRGGKKVQDWRAAIRVWKRSEYFPSQRQAAKTKPVDDKARVRAAIERMQTNDRNRTR
jgi:hypothetical protein